jgi:hypothetical protein
MSNNDAWEMKMTDDDRVENPQLVDSHGMALNNGPDVKPREATDAQLESLKTEIENLRRSVAAIAANAKSFGADKIELTIADVEETLKRNVFMSVGIAALIGYAWGRIR